MSKAAKADKPVELEFRVNGKPVCVMVPPALPLLDILRSRLGLTGTKRGCGKGECGACTVLLEGKPVNSCLVPAVQLLGAEVTTIEGLGGNRELHPIQEAFIEAGAVQCGFCTPGMILSAKSLLDASPRPSREEIRASISGNLCRCTGYIKIFDAIGRAAELLAKKPRRTVKPGKSDA